MVPELSDLQWELLLTPSTLDSKIPFLHYLPILQELLQLVQHLRQQCQAQVLAINPQIGSPPHSCTHATRLAINSKIERFLSLSMALAWRFCTIALVLLPQLPSYRASFHETVLRPFKREAAQYLARIQTYHKLGALRYLEADLSSMSKDPEQQQQQQQPQAVLLANDSTEDNTQRKTNTPSFSNELVQAATREPSQSVQNGTPITIPISSRGTMAPAATLQLHNQIDASKAFPRATSSTVLSTMKVAAPVPAHEPIRLVPSAPRPSPKTSHEHLDRTMNGRFIAEKERAILNLPLPTLLHVQTATSVLSDPTTAAPSCPAPPLPHPPRRLVPQQVTHHVPAVVITAPTPSISPLTTAASTGTAPKRRTTRSLAFGSTASTITNTARFPMSPAKVLIQRRVSVQSLIQRFEHSVPSAETYRMAAKYRDRRLSLPHLQRELESAEPSALTPKRSHHNAPSSQSPSLRLRATATGAAAAPSPLISATTSEAIVPYHLRDELSRIRSTRDHIRSLPAYQLSRIEDKKHRLSIASSLSSLSSSHTTVTDSSSLTSMRLNNGLGTIQSTDGGDVSSEEERSLSKLAETVDRCVAGIVGRVESALSLSRVIRADFMDRPSAACSTLGRTTHSFQPTAGSFAPRMGENDALVVARASRAPTETQQATPSPNRIINDNSALSLATQRHMPFNNPDRTAARTPNHKNASSASQGKVQSVISAMNRRSMSLTGSECTDAVVMAPNNSLKLLSGPVSPSTLPPLAQSQPSWPRRQESLRVPTTRDNSTSVSSSSQVPPRSRSGESASIFPPHTNDDDAGDSNNNRGDVDGHQSSSSSHVELIRVPTQSSTVSSWSSRCVLPAPLCTSGSSTFVPPTARAAYSTHSGHGNAGDNYSEGALQYLELYSPTPLLEGDSFPTGGQESALCTEVGPAWGSGARERRYAESDAASMTESSSYSSSQTNTVARSTSRRQGRADDESRIARPLLSWPSSEGVPAFTKPFKSAPQSSGEVRSLWSSPSIASTRSTSSLRLALPSTTGQWNPRPPQKNEQS